MDLKYKNDPNVQNYILNLDGDEGISDSTQKCFKDLKQDRFEYDHGGNFTPQKDKSPHIKSNKTRQVRPVSQPSPTVTRTNPEGVMKHIDWNHVRTFYYVVKAGSFKKAEKYLYVSQSSISRSIQNLEKSLGERLLLRPTSKRHAAVTLTPMGLMVLAQVSQGAESFEALNAYLYHHNKNNIETV